MLKVETLLLPQELRPLRHVLRACSSWHGYGLNEPGTMIAAHPHHEEVHIIFQELEVQSDVRCSLADFLDFPQPKDFVKRCWNLDAHAELAIVKEKTAAGSEG